MTDLMMVNIVLVEHFSFSYSLFFDENIQHNFSFSISLAKTILVLVLVFPMY